MARAWHRAASGPVRRGWAGLTGGPDRVVRQAPAVGDDVGSLGPFCRLEAPGGDCSRIEKRSPVERPGPDGPLVLEEEPTVIGSGGRVEPDEDRLARPPPDRQGKVAEIVSSTLSNPPGQGTSWIATQ